MIILRVALDVPLPKLFDYRSVDATRADIGYRVLVPFGTKHRVGVIVDVAAKSEVADSRLRPVEKILRDVPPLPRDRLALAKFCSDYYHRPLGEVVMSALPPRLRTAKAIPGSAVDYVLTPAGREALALMPERHKRLRALLGRLARSQASQPELEALARSARSLLKRAIESGWVASIDPPRLAVFTPLPRLGLVVVDEEQDASFKQREGVRYSARDLAVARARAASVPVVLCSATPSLETFHHATSGKYELVQLTRRAIDRAALPAVRLIDTRAHPPSDGVAAPLLEALAACLARGEQSLVFLNRRGYAPVLACPACGWVKGCKRCSAHMVVHLAEQRLRCHHCGLAEGIPRTCPDFGGPD